MRRRVVLWVASAREASWARAGSPLRAAAFALLFGAPLVLPVAACSDKTIPPPASDKNFDDPDEPRSPGQVGTTDAGTADAAIPCSSDVDCPPKARRCMFAVDDGCSAQGTCVDYVEPTNCQKTAFCACAGGTVSACAPAGLAPMRAQSGASCEALDAGADAADAADARGDARDASEGG